MIEQQIPQANGTASVRAHGGLVRHAAGELWRAPIDDPRAGIVDAFVDEEMPVEFDRAHFGPSTPSLAANTAGGAAFHIHLPAAICEMADA